MQHLILETTPALRHPVMVLAFSGWNDAGQSATAAVRYLIEQLNAARFARVDPEDFYDFTVARPHVRLLEGRQRAIDWVSFDLYAASIQSAEHDYIFGWGPEPHLKWKAFCASLLDLARQYDAQSVVTLGGYLAEVLYTRPVAITGFSTDSAILQRLDVAPTRYEGPTGIVGVLGAACRDAGVTHVSLWGALPHYIAAVPNPRGALALVLRLMDLVRLPIDVTSLKDTAAEFEQKVNEAVANDAELSAYIRELKKREFAN